MLDIFFAMMAAGMNGSHDEEAAAAAPVADPPAAIAALPQADSNATVTIGEGSVVVGENVVIQGAPAAAPAATPAPAPAAVPAPTGFDMSVVPAGLVAEDQTPSGKFTTATEIKPILDATRGSWVAVREYDGKDWLYVTHLWGWRCGLAAMAISVNDEPMQNWPLPPCHMKYTTPNAILEDDGIPALTLQLGGVQKITIQVVYDDLTMDIASFARGDVLIP